jgi:hypothetical protein
LWSAVFLSAFVLAVTGLLFYGMQRVNILGRLSLYKAAMEMQVKSLFPLIFEGIGVPDCALYRKRHPPLRTVGLLLGGAELSLTSSITLSS